MESEFNSKSFSEIFFKEVTFEGFLELYGDFIDQLGEGKVDHSENFKARYDYYYILSDLNKSDLEEIIEQKKVNFKAKNGFYNQEQFLIFEGVNNFFDEVNDYLESFRKSKTFLIEKKNNHYFHHFELSYNTTTGKTVIISNKNNAQLHYYLNEIKNVIKDRLKELSSIKKTANLNLHPLDYDYDTILSKVKNMIEKIDVKGWKYLFDSQEDYNLFAKHLADYFANNEVGNLNKIIKVNNRTQTKTGYILNTIHQKLSSKTLKSDENYLKLVRILSSFKEFSLDKTYEVIQKGKQNF